MNVGFDRRLADALLRAGRCAQELPVIGAAFASGELSLDKVRSLSTIATAEDQEAWVAIALGSSAPELWRICREQRNSSVTDDASRVRLQQEQRFLRFRWDELSMLRISGALPPEDGAVVENTLITLRDKLRQERQRRPRPLDMPDDTEAALQADALAMVFQGTPAGGNASPARPLMVVHVDYDLISGKNPNGRGHIENGPALSMDQLRRLGCDSRVKVLIERDGEPVFAGREKRIPTDTVKLAVKTRDRTCRVPKCSMPASGCECHHLLTWMGDWGPSETWNLASLCDFHHGCYHRHEFSIRRTPEGDLVFLEPDGTVMGTATGGHWKLPKNWRGP